jgi:hypothetical protein
MAIRLNLRQIVVDVVGQHRIAADGNSAFLERRQREVTCRCQEALGHRDVEVGAHAIDLARYPDFLPAFISLAVDGQREDLNIKHWCSPSSTAIRLRAPQTPTPVACKTASMTAGQCLGYL